MAYRTLSIDLYDSHWDQGLSWSKVPSKELGTHLLLKMLNSVFEFYSKLLNIEKEIFHSLTKLYPEED